MKDFLHILLSPSTATGAIHVTLAVTSLILGPVIFRGRKGDARHKFLGRIWAAMMLILNISALLTYELYGRPNLFHFFAVMNLFALIPGIHFIRKFGRTKNPVHLQLHQEMMAWAYFGLAAAGVWQIATSLVRAGMVTVSHGLVFNLLGACTFLAAVILTVYFRRKRVPSP